MTCRGTFTYDLYSRWPGQRSGSNGCDQERANHRDEWTPLVRYKNGISKPIYSKVPDQLVDQGQDMLHVDMMDEAIESRMTEHKQGVGSAAKRATIFGASKSMWKAILACN